MQIQYCTYHIFECAHVTRIWYENVLASLEIKRHKQRLKSH